MPSDKREWWARIDPHSADVLDDFLRRHDITKTAWLEAIAVRLEAIGPQNFGNDPTIALARQITDERRRRPR